MSISSTQIRFHSDIIIYILLRKEFIYPSVENIIATNKKIVILFQLFYSLKFQRV